jgi:hypothetical protein
MSLIANHAAINHVNFALLDLFDYSFASRHAQVGKVINEMFDVKEDKHPLQHFHQMKVSVILLVPQTRKRETTQDIRYTTTAIKN